MHLLIDIELCLYNFKDLAGAYSFLSLKTLRTLISPRSWDLKFWKSDVVPEETDDMDPHYKLMLAYKEVPDWWYKLVFLIAGVVGLVCIYAADSGLTWWSFIIAIVLAAVMILFIGAQYGLTGFRVPVEPLMQMMGAFIQPGRPLTNMYVFRFSLVVQKGLS